MAISSKHIRISLIHTIFWLGLLSLMIYFNSGRYEGEAATIRGGYTTAWLAIVAYANMFYLIPKLFIPKKYVIYSLVLIATTWSLIEWLDYSDDHFLPKSNFYLSQINNESNNPPSTTETAQKKTAPRPKQARIQRPPRGRSLFGGTLIIAIWFMSTAYKMTEIALTREHEASELRNQKLEAEMKFLKSQINPHFLFNALNNAYTLSYIKSEQAPEVILKLSNMLRYLIYECNAPLVALDKELAYIRNYIDLQQMKGEGNIEAIFEVSDPNVQIEPMIFIPFIENSFKHSQFEDPEQGWIKMKLTADSQKIHFHIANSNPEQGYTKDKVGGIGLDNVKKRLDLLYAHRHSLQIMAKEGIFEVNLTLQLS